MIRYPAARDSVASQKRTAFCGIGRFPFWWKCHGKFWRICLSDRGVPRRSPFNLQSGSLRGIRPTMFDSWFAKRFLFLIAVLIGCNNEAPVTSIGVSGAGNHGSRLHADETGDAGTRKRVWRQNHMEWCIG